MTSNPWGLTEAQCATLESLAMAWSSKQAARLNGISHKTIEQHIHTAKKRMGIPHRLGAVLEWDRWKRAHGGVL